MASMETKQHFTMPPPNEDCNEEDIPLDRLHNASHKYITADQFFKPTPEEPYCVTEAWDGWLTTDLIRQSPVIADILDELWSANWPIMARKKLASGILNLFQSQYAAAVDAERKSNREYFFEVHPTYLGQIPAFNPLTEQEKRLAARSFESALPVVTQWAMCNFSRYRQEWAKGKLAEQAWSNTPVNITNQILTSDDEEILAKPIKRRGFVAQREQAGRITAKQKREEKLKAMTPEERKKFLLNESLAKEVKKLYRQGKIDEQVLLDLEIE